MGDLRPAVASVAIVLPILAIVTYIGRIRARYVSKAGLAADDYCIGLALVLAVGCSIDVILAWRLGNLGGHLSTTPSGQPLFDEVWFHVQKCGFAAQILWLACVTFTKIGVLLFYRRIFVNRQFVRVVLILISFCVLWGLASLPTLVAPCIPVAKTWDPRLPGKCVNKVALWAAISAIDVLTDIIIWVLPIYNVWQLRMATARKIAVTSIFLLGVLLIVSSVVRLIYVTHAVPAIKSKIDTELSHLFIPMIIWAVIEDCLGVICANLIALGPLFKRQRFPSIVRNFGRTLSVGDASLGKPGTFNKDGLHGESVRSKRTFDIDYVSMPHRNTRNAAEFEDVSTIEMELGTTLHELGTADAIAAHPPITRSEILCEYR